MARVAVFLSTYRPWAISALLATIYFQIYSNEVYSVRGALLQSAKCLFACLSVWAFYLIFLYHRFFSPLRHLPQPDVSSSNPVHDKCAHILTSLLKGAKFINGHWAASIHEPAGLPFRHWSRTIENNGLIRYLSVPASVCF